MSLNETIQPRGQDQDPRNEVGNNIEKILPGVNSLV